MDFNLCFVVTNRSPSAPTLAGSVAALKKSFHAYTATARPVPPRRSNNAGTSLQLWFHPLLETKQNELLSPSIIWNCLGARGPKRCHGPEKRQGRTKAKLVQSKNKHRRARCIARCQDGTRHYGSPEIDRLVLLTPDSVFSREKPSLLLLHIHRISIVSCRV